MSRPGLVLLLALLLAMTAPLRVIAHGGGVAQVTDAPAGPYRVFTWTSPDPWRAGEAAHVTVAVTRVEGDQTFPVTDAQVRLNLTSALHPDQKLILLATPVSTVAAGFYEADHELPYDGIWNVEVNVEGRDGVGVVSFAMQAAPAAAANNWLVWAGGALALLAGIGLVLGTRRRASTRPAAMPAPAQSSVVQE